MSCLIHQRNFGVAHGIEDVIPEDGGDPETVQAERASDLHNGPGGTRGIGRAHIADDFYAARMAMRQNSRHPFDQQSVISSRGVAKSSLLGQGDRTLGQAFEDEVVQSSVDRELDGRLDPVTAEA